MMRSLRPRWCRAVVFLSLLAGVALVGGCGGMDLKKKKDGGSPRAVDAGREAKTAEKGERETIVPRPDILAGRTDDRPAPAAPPPVLDQDKRPAKKDDGRPQDDVKGGTADSTKGGRKGTDAPRPKTPQVWHRDGSRPSFARVYVGDGNKLELVSLHVSVIVEGPRARTLVDHVFRNPHERQLEGTFEYPLPTGASPSYDAMFLGDARATPPPRFKPQGQQGAPPLRPELLAPAQLARQVDAADWGKLQEARVVAPERAREVYEEVVRGRIDPALLEYASGNTFRGRVFPIPPKGYNRVILAYEETLPVTAGRLLYRYPLPDCKLNELRFTLQADPRECKAATIQPRDARKETSTERVAFTRTWSETTPQGEVIFSATPATPAVQATSGRHGDKGPLYLYARLRPELPKVEKEEPFAQHAVLLLDTSLSEDPDRFAVSMKLLEAILANDAQIKYFNVLAFNAGAAWLEPKGWLANTKAGREAALKRLDGLVLEGATDLSAALEKLLNPGFAVERGTPLACFLLSDGHLTWGQTEVAPLVARFRSRCTHPVRFFCYRTGLGEENAELFDALTRDGGGVYQCYGAAEVAAAAQAHRRQCLHVERVRIDGLSAGELLVAGRRSAVYPDGELILTGHFARAGKATVLVEGRFQGQRYSRTFPVEVREGGELAPRGWGEVAVTSLLALNDPWVDDLVTAYCQEFNIASRSASFLVLEREEDYRRFNIDKEKARLDQNDVARYLDAAWSSLGKEPSAKQALGRLLFQIDPARKVLSGPSGEHVKALLALLSEADCALPIGAVDGKLLRAADADKDYLEGRKKNRRDVHVYLAECQRRHTDDDVAGAVRALSSVVELHPGRGDALRLVGYRLLDLGQPALASGLFARVLRQRPFEPHSFRDLARSLEEGGRHALAALLYEAVLAGSWDSRFGDALKLVTREDHVRLLRAGVRDGKLTAGQRAFFARRLEQLRGSESAADLRVSITWNTDNTDVDLWVIEPDRTKVMYSSPRSPSGGELSPDLTQGYGPERYQIRTARKGEYVVLVHYYRANPNLLGGETHVSVTITRHAGTPRERVEKRTVILKRHNDQVEVARLRF